MGRLQILASVGLALLLGACEPEPPAAENQFACTGMASQICERLLREAQQNVPNAAPLSAVIRCTARACTEAEGEASVVVTFSNGQRVEYGTGWQAAHPAPEPVRTGPVGPSPSG